jgi:glutaminase
MYFMASEGGFPPNVKKEDALDFYFQMCSVEISCKKLGLIASTYANYGICPLTGEKTMSFETVKQTMQLCLTCGMYDYSGEWACTVGLPAKSGVAGDLWVVVPSKMGICTYSPPLDNIGNSVRGVEFATRITQEFGWSVFDSVHH